MSHCRWSLLVPSLGLVLSFALATSLVAQPPTGIEGSTDPAAKIPFTEYDPPQTLRGAASTRWSAPGSRSSTCISHQFELDEAKVRQLVGEMDAMNMAVMVNLSGRGFRRVEVPGGRPRFGFQPPQHLRDLIALTERVAPGRIVHFTNVDFSAVGGERLAGEGASPNSRPTSRAGARGLKIYKGLGHGHPRRRRAAHPRRRPAPGPDLRRRARLEMPVLIHTADPAQFWQPKDKNNERLYELIEVPGRTRDAGSNIPWEQLITEQHDLFRRHPRTTLHQRPPRLARQRSRAAGQAPRRVPQRDRPRSARCSPSSAASRASPATGSRATRTASSSARTPTSRPNTGPTSGVLETADDSFPYYRRRHAFWKIYGLDLPDPVLRKLYSGNATRIVPGLAPIP